MGSPQTDLARLGKNRVNVERSQRDSQLSLQARGRPRAELALGLYAGTRIVGMGKYYLNPIEEIEGVSSPLSTHGVEEGGDLIPFR